MSSADSAAEDAALDRAFSRADDLLVASLKTDESKRHRRMLIAVTLTVGGLIMTTVIALILSGLLGGNAQTGNPSSADLDRAAAISQQGWQLFMHHDLAQAEAKFEQAVKLDPHSAAAWNGLGWSENNQGKSDEAEKAFNKVLEIEPAHAAAENGLGWIAFNRQQFDRAEEHWKKSAQTPGATAAMSGLAQLYIGQQKWDDATTWAQKLVEADPNDAEGKKLLVAAKDHHVPPEIAKALQPAPAHAAANPGGLQRGWQLLNAGNVHQAIDVFTDMLKANPSDANAQNGLGWALLRSGQSSQAKYHFQAAIKADPNAGGSMNGLAMILKNEGKTDDAIQLWKQMQEKFPGVNAATANLASTYLEKQDYAAALPYCEQLAAATPDDPNVKAQLEQARAGAAKP